MAHGGTQNGVDAGLVQIPVDFTGEELTGLFTIVAATAAGGPGAHFVSPNATPYVQLRRFLTPTARGRLTLAMKSVLNIIYALEEVPVEPIWAELAYPVAGTNRHETPAQQLFCVLCYFGRLLMEPKTGHPSPVPYYQLLRYTSHHDYKEVLLASELLEPIRAALNE